MSNAVFEVFDASLQKTQVWLNDLMVELGWENRPQKACLALRTALHALRDRLTVEEAVHLGAQLPILIRGVYYEGWKLTGKPVKERHKSEFLDHIAAVFRDDDTVDPEKVMRSVFKVLARHISKGEIDNVKNSLPKSLQDLWP
ncbi:MAG TPA: DUF2267 domain-containing protein [Candidatus Binatia bacterium]|nr:DUF2267 domain-containing protein [Candidatus Binatia bacterium]